MKESRNILLTTCMFLLLLPKLLFAQLENTQKIKVEFLIDLKFSLLFQEKYSNEINQQLKVALSEMLKGNLVRDSLIELKNEHFLLEEFLNSDETIKKCVNGVKSYSYDTNTYQFSKQKYPFDQKALNKLQHFSFVDSTMEVGDYYFVLSLEIHQLLELLNGNCHGNNVVKNQEECVIDSLSRNSFVGLSKFEFHSYISNLLSEFEDAHLSLYSSFTYSFYEPINSASIKAIKSLGDTSFLLVKGDSPIVSKCNFIDTISFSLDTRSKLDTLRKITHRNYATNHLKAKFIGENYDLSTESNIGVYLPRDSIIFINMQEINNQSKRRLRYFNRKNDIKLIVFDLRAYSNLPESAYEVLIKAAKIKSKIAVLIDKNTYSLSEILARKLSHYDNTTIIGECSAGAMGESNIVKLNRPYSLQYTAYWYDDDAFYDYTLRKVCPDKNFKFKLPAGYLLESELKAIVKLIP